MAATKNDDATATLKGDDEKDFGQETNQKKIKAKIHKVIFFDKSINRLLYNKLIELDIS